MRTFHWLVIIAIHLDVSVLCKAAPSSRADIQFNSHQKRFLIVTGNPLLCNGVCSISCTNGYQKSIAGCYLCICEGTNSTSNATQGQPSPFVPSNFSINAGQVGIFFDKPCDPSVRHCPLRCTIGYETGKNGCQLCVCVDKLPANVITLSPNTSITTPQPATPVIDSTPIGQNKTALPTFATSTTTAQRTSSFITSYITSPTKPNSGFTDPCITSQTVCNLNCGNSYVLGPESCQYCLCADILPSQLRQTTPSATVNPSGFSKANASLVDQVTTTATSKPSPEACIMAKVICNQKCPNGFISRPDDCLYCSCIKIRTGHLATTTHSVSLKLRKPCLYGNDGCETQCTIGFIRGPRNCQFCSCKSK